MPKVSVNSSAAIANFEAIWTETVNANHLLAEMLQEILLNGYNKPFTKEFLNRLMIYFLDPARESCRKATKISLECRKMIVDKANNSRKKKRKLK